MQYAQDTYLDFYTDRNHLYSRLEKRRNYSNQGNFESKGNRFDSLQSPDYIRIDNRNSRHS